MRGGGGRKEKGSLHTCPGLPTMHLLGGGVRVKVWIREQRKIKRRSKALLSLCWQSWTSLKGRGDGRRGGWVGQDGEQEQTVLRLPDTPVQLMRPGLAKTRHTQCRASVNIYSHFREMMFFDRSYKYTCTYIHTCILRGWKKPTRN